MLQMVEFIAITFKKPFEYSVGGDAFAIVAGVGEEGQADVAALRHSEAPIGFNEGAGSKAGCNGARVALLRLGDPPAQQVALLPRRLPTHSFSAQVTLSQGSA